MAQVYPDLFFWVAYPFTVLLEAAWKQEYTKICKNTLPCPYIVEFVCMLERLLVYAHTGNTVVLHRSTMGSLSMIQGILENGFPTITREVVHYPSGSGGPMRVDASRWPSAKDARFPAVASRATQTLYYKSEHFYVSSKTVLLIMRLPLFFLRSTRRTSLLDISFTLHPRYPPQSGIGRSAVAFRLWTLLGRCISWTLSPL